MQKKLNRILVILFSILMSLVLAQSTIAQPPAPAKKPMPKFPMSIEPDPRVEQRKYHFEETDEDLGYVLYVSSKVSKDNKNPLIVALHGLGGDAKIADGMPDIFRFFARYTKDGKIERERPLFFNRKKPPVDE